MATAPEILTRDHPAWPLGLLDLSDAPRQLFLLGQLPEPAMPSVAIVGSREPSREARRFAQDLAAELAAAGVLIVSGGARGVDAAAHEGALEAGGRSVAILPGDVTRPVPAVHRPLFRRLCREGGALISEHEVTPEHAGAFVTRNRLIAAWARAVVVVEARLRSGTRSTAVAARRLARPVFAVPWSPFHAPGAGGLRLLEEGARVLCSAGPLLELLGLHTRPVSVPAGVVPRPEGLEGRVLEALEHDQAASLDQLARHLRLPMPELLGVVCRLELSGMIERGGGSSFRVTARFA